jgi:signal transduction histidine kinase
MSFTRSYSLEDIGHVPRGSRLGFDRFGRIAVIHDAVYAVLNDSTWLNLAEEGGPGRLPISNAVQAADGGTYYGARSSWGRVATGEDGRLHPVPLVPPNPPGWISTAVFADLIPTDRGVYFSSWNGVVFWDFQRKKSILFEVPRLSRSFLVGGKVYVSAFESPLRYIDVDTESLVSAAGTSLDTNVVEFATTLDSTHSLVSLLNGRLFVFDGRKVSTWLPPGEHGLEGTISLVQQLADGFVAIGFTGRGLFIFSPQGELLVPLTTSEYRNVTAVASREPGVLWVETEDQVEKVFYGSPLSAFGQRLGLPIAWPIVASWNGQIVVASAGKLYRAVSSDRSEPTYFKLDEKQPPSGAWSLAAWGSHLLAGSGSGLFAAEADGVYEQVPSFNSLVHLVMTDENHCYAIGRTQIAFLEWHEGHWTEPVARIGGIANPAVVHRIKNSVWIEMGGDGVARLSVHDGQLKLDVIRNESWTKASWVNVGAAGGMVVLSSLREEPHRFFDENTGAPRTAPWLETLLGRSPYWIARVQQDETGVIWAGHNEGLVRFKPDGAGGYDIDVTNYDLVNDRYPVVRLLPGNDAWVSTARSLYHIERTPIPTAPPPRQPLLVSVTDSRRNSELLVEPAASALSPNFPYAQNSLNFRFFSGTDAWRRPPVYEFRLNDGEPWTPFDGSLLTFHELHEGGYRLQVRRAAPQGSADAPLRFEFHIQPPWHRSWPAYLLFGSVGLALLGGAVRWSSYLDRRRTRALEHTVAERTRQLEEAMARLGEETRKAATLAERDRLANEIHDSVQQGLTGAILQIDTTLDFPSVAPEIRPLLNVARNMVSYARQEVQHAVWDMESPLLEGSELGDALRNLTTFVDAGKVTIEVLVEGDARPLGRTINHNLLRVAQEATTNAFRHAQAQKITIRLKYETDRVALEIADDGVGFSAGEVMQARAGHLGLRGMRTRVKKLHGKLSIDSAPGRGTSIRVVVPTPPANASSPDSHATEHA